MRKVAFDILAVFLTIIWICGSLVYSAPCAKAESNTLSETSQGKLFGAATSSSPKAGGKSSGGMPSRPTPKPGTYVVRTVWKDAPLTNVRIEWRRQIDDAVPMLSGNSIRLGTANFKPASGLYYLTADWRPDGDFARPRKPGDRFAWLGSNPLLVSSETSEAITLLLEEVPPLKTIPSLGTGISGTVTFGSVPAASIGVYAYAKTGSGFKENDFQAKALTNSNGEFILDLPPGRYYLLARLRTDNSIGLGPLNKGDLLGYDPRNPIIVENGRYAASAIPLSRLKMFKSRVESSSFLPGVIEGRIVDREGHPVSGVHAVLYNNPKMVGRYLFWSEPSGEDGRFRLYAPVPGSYFLGARSGTGGAPTSGGWSGAWSGSSDHSIKIKTGDNRVGVEIVVDRLSLELKSSE